MALTRGLFIRKDGASIPSPIGTGPVDARKDLASLVAVQDGIGTIRSGLFYPAGAATVVTGNATGWQYNVAAFEAAIARIANNADGVTLIANDGAVTVPTIGAPGTGSRYDLLYLLLNESTSAATDSKPSLNCYSGPNSGTPSKSAAIAALPAGAYLLGSALVPSTAASTADAAVTITQEFRWTAGRGAPIPVRTQAERDEFTKYNGLTVKRLDISGAPTQTCDGTNWRGEGVLRPFGHMGRTAGFQTITSGGTVVGMTAAQELRGGMTFDAATSSLVIPLTGDYRITAKTYLTGGSAYGGYAKSQKNLTDISGSVVVVWKGDTQDYQASSVVVKPLSAGDKINLINAGNNSSYGSDGYNGAFLEVEYIGPPETY